MMIKAKRLSAAAMTLLLTAVTAIPLTPALTVNGAAVVNLNSESVYNRTKADILRRYEAALPADPDAPLYSSAGNNKSGNYVGAVLTEQTKQNILKVNNYYRWLGGLTTFTLMDSSDPVWDYDAKGSVLLSVSNFDHNPAKPSDMSSAFYNDAIEGTSNSSIAKSNGAAGQDVLVHTMRLWLNDDGYTVPGHRDMFLTRNGYQLGYGMFTDSDANAVYQNNTTSSCQTVRYQGTPNPGGKSAIGNDEAAYAWPAPGYFPSDELSTEAPWTVTLNTDKLKYSSLSNVKVTMTDLSTNTTYTRTSSSGLYDTYYWGKTLSFTAPGVTSYANKSFQVDITGLTNASGNSVTVSYTTDFFPYYSFSNQSYLSSNSIPLGDPVVIYAKGSGGTGSYKYNYFYKTPYSTDWSQFNIEDRYSIITYTPSTKGVYQLKVRVTDSDGTYEDKVLTLNVGVGFNADFTVSDTTTYTGQTVALNASSTGAVGEGQYCFEYKHSNDTDYTILQNYSTKASANFVPTTAGTYQLRISARDSSDVANVLSKEFTLTVKSPSVPLTNNSTISAEAIEQGDSVTLQAKSAGGSGPYWYGFYYKKSTNNYWTTIGTEFVSAASVTLTPSSVGSYDVKIAVKDSSGTVVEKTFTLTVTGFTNESTVSAVSVRKGTPVTIYGKASGGSGSYTYAYYYKKSSSSAYQQIGSGYITASSAQFTPGSAADYLVKVVVKDSNGKTVTKYITVKATDAPTLVNQSTLSTTEAVVGTVVTITGKAGGGSGSYTYAYYYKKSSSSAYQQIGSGFTGTATAKFTPGSATGYSVKVVVKDSSGATATKYLTVQAKNGAALVNRSTVSATSVTKGNAVTLYGKAEGGSGSYTYAYYYKKSTSAAYQQIGSGFSTAQSGTFTPGMKADYLVKIIVKDSAGKTAAKYITVTSK